MADYTVDQLMDAVKAQVVQDESFRNQLEEAVDLKSSSRILDLIAQVAKWFFGGVVKGIAEAVWYSLFS